MAHQRRDGWRVSTYQAPAELIDAAKAKASDEDTTVSAVIRDALTDYVKEET